MPSLCKRVDCSGAHRVTAAIPSGKQVISVHLSIEPRHRAICDLYYPVMGGKTILYANRVALDITGLTVGEVNDKGFLHAPSILTT